MIQRKRWIAAVAVVAGVVSARADAQATPFLHQTATQTVNAPDLPCAAPGWGDPSTTDAARAACRDSGSQCGVGSGWAGMAAKPEIFFHGQFHMCYGPDGSFSPLNKRVNYTPETFVLTEDRSRAWAQLRRDALKRATTDTLPGADSMAMQETRDFCGVSPLPAYGACDGASQIDVPAASGAVESCGEWYTSSADQQAGASEFYATRPASATAVVPGLPLCLVQQGSGGTCATRAQCSTSGPNPLTFGQPGATAGSVVDYPSLNVLMDKNPTTWRSILTAMLDSWVTTAYDAVAKAQNAFYCNDISKGSCRPRDPAYFQLNNTALSVLDEASKLAKKKDIGIVLDRSGSMYYSGAAGSRRVDGAVEAIETFLTMLKPSPLTTVGLYSYGTSSTADDATCLLANPAASAPCKSAAPIASTAFPAGEFAAAGLGSDYNAAVTTPAATWTGLTKALWRVQHNFQDAGTSIGFGLQNATTSLCGSAPCSADKTFIVFTDGLENSPPCIDPTGARCRGPAFDQAKLGDASVCTIGFGSSTDVDTDLLKKLARDHRGAFNLSGDLQVAKASQNAGFAEIPTDSAEVAMKSAFAKCAGDVLNAPAAVDPVGVLRKNELSAAPESFATCMEKELLFLGGWGRGGQPDEVHMLVNAPNGNLVLPNRTAGATGGIQSTFNVTRVANPAEGTWRTQVIRHHNRYVNAFAPSAFANLTSEGVPLVRRQIQRLCPNGCSNVLYYEETAATAASAYKGALDAEVAAGLVSSVTKAATEAAFATALASSTVWDLIVYANTDAARTTAPSYESALTTQLCQTSTPAVITEFRTTQNAQVLQFCSGALLADGGLNFTSMVDTYASTGGRLISSPVTLRNPGGLTTFSRAVTALDFDGLASRIRGADTSNALGTAPGAAEGQLLTSGTVSTTPAGAGAAFLALVVPGVSLAGITYPPQASVGLIFDSVSSGLLTPVRDGVSFLAARRTRAARTWFSEIRFDGLSAINPLEVASNTQTGNGVTAAFTVPVTNIPRGGYVSVAAKARVEYPTQSLGKKVQAVGCGTTSSGTDTTSGRALALDPNQIPHLVREVALNDAGTNGDLLAGNYTWSTKLHDMGLIDGEYTIRYLAEFTVNRPSGGTCVQRREVMTSFVMKPKIDFSKSQITHQAVTGGEKITFTPQDASGNLVGCGEPPKVSCDSACGCPSVTDNGNGSYTATVTGNRQNGCNCIKAFGSEICGGPKVVAPNMTVNVCAAGTSPVVLSVKASQGTATGRVIVNNAPMGDTIYPSNPKVRLPAGTSTIRWTVTNGTETATVNQTVNVVVGTDTNGTCCPYGSVVVTGDAVANNYDLSDDVEYCVLGNAGIDTITTGPGYDVIFGGADSDIIANLSEEGYSSGGAGVDAIYHARGGEIHGGANDDGIDLRGDGEAWGNDGADVFRTGPTGAHYLYPGAGRDTVFGGAGTDIVTVFSPCEFSALEALDGGGGNDTLVIPVPASNLWRYGVVAVNFENIIVRTDLAYLAECR